MATTWLRSQYYGRGASVLYNGYSFTSLQNSNIANIPPTSPTWWQGAQGIQGLTQGPGISVNTSDPAAPVISTDVQFNQGTGITVSGPTGAHPQQWTIAQTSTGVTSLANGEALPETGPLKLVGGTNTTIDSTTTPGSFIFNTPAVASLANGAGTAQTGPLKLVAGSNMAIDSTTTAGSFILSATGGAGGVTSVSDDYGTTRTGALVFKGSSGLSVVASTVTPGDFNFANTGVTSVAADTGLYLSGAGTGNVQVKSHTFTMTYDTAGTQTPFTAEGDCIVFFTICGGGGGGGSAGVFNIAGQGQLAGGGGASGQTLSGTLRMVNNQSLTIVVGGGGAGGVATGAGKGQSGSPGGPSYVSIPGILWRAEGGEQGYTGDDGNTAGRGGDASSVTCSKAFVYGFGGGGGAAQGLYPGNPGDNVPADAGGAPDPGNAVPPGGTDASGGNGGGGGGLGGAPSVIAGYPPIAVGGGGGGGPYGGNGGAWINGTYVVTGSAPRLGGGGGGGGGALTTPNALLGPGTNGADGFVTLTVAYVG